MSALALNYWRERLENMCPYVDTDYLRLPYCTIYNNVQGGLWPTAISIKASYADFLGWWHDRYVLPLDDNTTPPKPPHKRVFLSTLRDYVQLVHPVPKLRYVLVPRDYEGSTFYEKRYQRFIFLKDWKEHVDIFEKLTRSNIRVRSQQIVCMA